MLETKDDLRIHRMLDPERAVLVEFGDALLRRHTGSVVTRTKSRIACFAGPSFHEASGAPVWASAAVASRSPGSAGIAPRAPSTRRRLSPSEVFDDMIHSR